MLIYSAKFPVRKNFVKEEFIRLTIEWNQKSPYDKMSGIEWNEKLCNLRWQDNNKELMIDDLPESNVIASRFKKEDEFGVVWTTDFVLNYKEHMLVIYLDRETTESTINFTPTFSPPYFLKLVIRRGFAGKDKDLDVLDKAHTINLDNISIIEKIILRKERYSLPIVYVTKTGAGNYPLDIDDLARSLQGVAHVLKESESQVGKILMESCDRKNVHHGGIALYFPGLSAKTQKYNLTGYIDANNLMHKIINKIFRYTNQQIRENMYTWEGIQNQRLRLKNNYLLHEHKKIESENQDLYDTFGTQLKEYEESIESLNKRVQALMVENQGLREKLDGMDSVPLIFYGEEGDFYEGEIKEIILDVLLNYISVDNTNSRRKHIINDILASNDFRNLSKERKKGLRLF